MTQRQLANVLFAVLGVFVVLYQIPQLVMGIGMMAQLPFTDGGGSGQERIAGAWIIVATVVSILVGVVLTLQRDRIAGALFPQETARFTAPQMHSVALSVLGCYFAVSGLSRLLAEIGIVHPGRVDHLDQAAVVHLVLGLALFFGSRGLTRMWTSARNWEATPGEHTA